MSAASALGWNENIWSMPQGNTALYGQKWSELSEENQIAAHVLCHFNVTWPGGGGDSINLLNWDNPVNDASHALAHISLMLTMLVVVCM
jgi:hypothetical protein